MKFLKWAIIIIAGINYGYMNFDGARALMVGDYTRPDSGEYAGQLGPWAELVSAIGINPESTLMKTIFLLWGALGLVIVVSMAMGIRKAPKALLILSTLTLWYLVIGTVSCIIVSILLLIYIRKYRQNQQLS